MKKTLFATAFAVAALASAPAFAQVTGYVGATAAYSEVDVSGVEADGEGFGVQGAVSMPLNDELSTQISAAYVDSADGEGALSGTAHLVSNLEGGRIAGFVGATEAGDEAMLAFGLLGEVHKEQVTFGVGATFATIDELDTDFWALNADARFFVSDNFRLDAGLGWLTGDVMGFETDAWTLGAGGEYQFAGPISVFGGVSRFDLEDIDLTIDTVAIGVRFNFGGTLKDRDRSGAGLNGIERVSGLANF